MLLTLTFFNAYAQQTGTIINGTLIDETKEPLIGATVQLLNHSTGYTNGTITDIDGRFELADLPIGGPYLVKISYIGFSNYQVDSIYLSQGDRLSLKEITLKNDANILESFVVTADYFSVEKNRLGVAKKITSKTLNTLPSPSRNYREFADLSPLSNGGSVAGAKGSMMGLTIDGVSNRRGMGGDLVGGAFAVSMEAIAEFEVATNSYDVTGGRGGAGSIKAITKSGTNDFHASAWSYYSGSSLTGSKLSKNGLRKDENVEGHYNEGSEFTTTQFGASASGAIIKDKLHFFVVGDYYKNASPWANHWDYENHSERDLGVKENDLKEVVNILENDLGIPQPKSDKLGGYDKQYGVAPSVPVSTANFLFKLDWKINDKNELSTKYNFHKFSNPRKVIGNGLFSAQYGEESFDHSLSATLNTQISKTKKNSLMFSTNYMYRPGQPYNGRAPVGRVYVESDFDGEKDGAEVFFGNQYWAPEIISQNAFQLIDNYSWLVGKSRFTVGFDLYHENIHDKLTHYQQGEFYYASVDDLRSNTPYKYERKTPLGNAGGLVNSKIFEAGIYGQVKTNLTKDIEMTAGLRWDATIIPVKPTHNALLEQELGIKNDVAPRDLNNFQPRLNLVWDVNSEEKNVFKLGGGAFVSQFTTQALTMSQIDNGVDYVWPVIEVGQEYADGSGRVVTQGDLPQANWGGYYQDFDKNVPGEGYVNQLVSNGVVNTDVPAYVVAVDENLKTPMTWKFNTGYYRRINKWLNAGVSGYYNATYNNAYYKNINWKDNSEFQLANEGGRYIYAPKSTLDASSTTANWVDGRKSDKFNQVLYYTSANWANTFAALVFEVNMKIRDGFINVSYTRGASKGGVKYNSGNAREYHYVGQSYNGFEQNMRNYYDGDDLRHKLLISAVSPSFKGFRLSTKFAIRQSSRFNATMHKKYDIAGIGTNASSSTNYIMPFIFDVNDPNLTNEFRSDYKELLENTSDEYREYLNENMGGFAEPFGGLNPFRTTWDMSLSKTFSFKNDRNLTFRMDVFNVLNLLNKDWGGYHYITNTNLYDVTGFDEQKQEYQYKIRSNAGTKYYQVSNPYTVQLGLKFVY